MKRYYSIILILILLSACASAQTGPAPQTPANPPQANPQDVDTIEHILAATYDVISGPAGPRNWDRFRTLFYPGARMIPTLKDPKGAIVARVSTPDEYATRAGEYFSKNGFFENSIANRIETWDHIAHVFSTYESRHAKDEKPFTRGINSFQLFNDGTRWWIMTIYWEGQDKDKGTTVPDKYLK
jgi:hypothetical protein